MALNSLWRRITRTDVGIILFLVLVALFSLWFSLGRSVGHYVVIYEGDKLVFTAPLGQERSTKLHGPLGETQVEIHSGKVRVTSSPCARKVCIGMGAIHRSGDLLACVPNRVVVRIEGDQGGYDLLSR